MVNLQGKTIRLAVMTWFLTLPPLLAQNSQAQKEAATGKSRSNDPKTKAPAEKSAWEEALGQVRLLASKFQNYRDAALAGRSLASLGAVVCQYDKALAPVFFSQGFNVVQARLREEKADAKEPLWLARSVIISAATQCDPVFAESMNQDRQTNADGKIPSGSFWSDLRTAQEALRSDQAKSLPFAENVSRHIVELEFPQLLNFYGFLSRLREQTPPAADQLFMQTLARIREKPTSAFRAISVLGNYVFGMSGGETSDRLGVFPLGNEYDFQVYLFRAQRAGASALVTLSYLETAADVFSVASFATQKETAAGYALAQQLIQRSNEIAPDFASQYESALQGVPWSSVDDDLKRRVAHTFATSPLDDVKTLEEELEKAVEPRRKDEIRLMLFTLRWIAKDLTKAAALANAVEDESLRNQLTALALFRRAQIAIDKKEIDQAQSLLGAVRTPLHRVLTLLAIAQFQLQKRETESATSVLNLAVRDAAQTGPEERPFLRVSTAILGAQLDAQMALRNLEDAVADFNQLDIESKTNLENSEKVGNTHRKAGVATHASNQGFVEFAEFGSVRRHFDLAMPGLTFGLPDAAKALRSAPPEHLTSILLNLQSEPRQGPALAAAAVAYLERAKPSSQPRKGS